MVSIPSCVIHMLDACELAGNITFQELKSKDVFRLWNNRSIFRDNKVMFLEQILR